MELITFNRAVFQRIVPLILQMKEIKLRWMSGAPTFVPTSDFFPSKILTPERKHEQGMLRMLVVLFLLIWMLVTQVCSVCEIHWAIYTYEIYILCRQLCFKIMLIHV